MLCSSWLRAFGTLCALALVQLSLPKAGNCADKLEWTRIFPAGGPAGTTVEVEATGKFPDWPLQVWSDTDGIRWTCQSEPGKLTATIDPKVPAGLHWVRLYSMNGSTSTRPFLVGTSMQRNEAEPNDQPSQANSIDDFPKAIFGNLEKKGDVDLYEVKLAAGQLLVATIDAAKMLQSPVDTNLQILDVRGFVLAENLDHVGLDPYLDFTAPKEGRYFVRVLGFPATPDSKIGFGGGTDWLYRLRLESKAGAFGAPIACPMSTELDVTSSRVKPGEGDSQDRAVLIELPTRVRGVINAPQQSHFFRFKAQAGSHYRVRIFAREYGSSLDATVAILDAAGKQLKQADDIANNRDPELLWDASKEGDYFVVVSDFHRQGGEAYEYLAIIEQRVPDYTLSIANDWIQSTIGKAVEVKVKVNRENKFAGTIQLEADGLPDTVRCEKAESKSEGDSSKTVTLKLEGTEAFQGTLRIVGRTSESPDDVRAATSENNKPIWLSITPK